MSVILSLYLFISLFHIEQDSVLIIAQDSFFYSTQNLYSRNSVRTREKGKRFYAALPLLLVLPSPMACWNSLSFIRASGLMTLGTWICMVTY